MKPAPTARLEERRAQIREFLADVSSSAEVRRLMETSTGYDAMVWSGMAETLGLQALLVPAGHGGTGGGWPVMAVALEEMGRVLMCAPFLSTAVLATTAIVRAGDEEAQRRWLPAIAAGRAVATVALAEPDRGWDPNRIATRATPSADEGYLLEGRKSLVLDGHVADLFVVPARTPEGLSLFTVEGAARGLTRTESSTLDQTRKLAVLDLAGVPARLLGRPGAGGAILRHVLDMGSVALAAEQVGGAQRCLEMSVEYATRRIQFGRPIGTFQAVQHRCADMFVAIESARAAAAHAVQGAAGQAPDLPKAAAVAKVCCSEAFFEVAAATIQVHGALGFTWDHDAHLYFKRATSSKVLLGAPADHRKLLADHLDL